MQAFKAASLAAVVVASESVERCPAGSATTGACAEELDEAGLLQLGAARHRKQDIDLAQLAEVAKTTTSKEGKRSRSKSSVAQGDIGTYWSEAYGSGYSWSIGRVVSDVLDFGGATGQVKFGIVTSEDVGVGDIWPTGGIQLNDGILGLAPGCINSGCANKTDAVSGLVQAHGLSSHVFTMCLDAADPSDSSQEANGTLGLGPSDISLPEDAQILPVVVGTGNQAYNLQAKGTVSVSVSGQEIHTYSPEEWDATQSIVDSGTGGLQMPPTMFLKVLDQLRAAILSLDQECQHLWGAYQPNAISRQMVECSVDHVPDITVSLGPNGNLTVPGRTIFAANSPCGDSYSLAWVPNPDNMWIFGTSFLVNKAVQFNVADPAAAFIAVLGPSDGCKVDYSEGQKYNVPISGGNIGQLLNPAAGVVTAEISLGTPLQQGFKVQLDTGSSDLLVYELGCMMYGPTSCMGKTDCASCMEPFHDGGDNWYVNTWANGKEKGNFSAACMEYYQEFFDKSGCVFGSNPEFGQHCGPLTLEELNAALPKYVRPYAMCAATRAVCGTSRYFDSTVSKTFMPKGPSSAILPTQAPPPFSADVDCKAAAPTCN